MYSWLLPVEAELAGDALQVSDETIAALHIALPGLIDSLHRAIKKGEPSVWKSRHAFHPLWRYGGGGADCGRSMVNLAKYVTMILA